MKLINNYKFLNEIQEKLLETKVLMSEEDIEELNIFFQEMIVKMKENINKRNQ